uniref:Uncharacterized protein n=1 Tax=Salix viminalis TaxID=40686 RepID=A0A6N2N5A6_SALVM
MDFLWNYAATISSKKLPEQKELLQFLPRNCPNRKTRPYYDSAGIYKKVTGTNTSLKQLEFAPKLPNVSYHHTAPVMSGSELKETVSAQSSVDLAVEGADHTGPFKFVAEKLMDLDEYLTYLRSWSAYQTAKTKGVELPRDDMIGSFKRAWNEDGHDQKAVKFRIYLRIGKVGNE